MSESSLDWLAVVNLPGGARIVACHPLFCTQKEKTKFFSKGQACFRASPLTKRYGWGVHSNAEGKIALYAVGSEEYQKLSEDQALKHLKAMRSKRA